MTNEIQVELRIQSSAGDNMSVLPLGDAVLRLAQEVSLYGKWVYVGTKRFHLDPDSEKSRASLAEALSDTPKAHVTGALRGGADMTLKQLKSTAKKQHIVGYSRMSKMELERILSKKTKSPKSKSTALSTLTCVYTKDQLEEFTLVRLKSICKEHGITGVSRKSKQEIVYLILDAIRQNSQTETPQKRSTCSCGCPCSEKETDQSDGVEEDEGEECETVEASIETDYIPRKFNGDLVMAVEVLDDGSLKMYVDGSFQQYKPIIASLVIKALEQFAR